MSAEPLGAVPRRRYALEDSGFNEVPAPMRRFYRRWRGATDALADNEALCPVCRVVLRAERELCAGDRLHCQPCMTQLELVDEEGVLAARVVY